MNWQTKKKAEEIKALLQEGYELKDILDKKFKRSKKALEEHLSITSNLFTVEELKILKGQANALSEVIPTKSLIQKPVDEEYYGNLTLLQQPDSINKMSFILENFDKLEKLLKDDKSNADYSSVTEVLHIPEECQSSKESDIKRASIRVKSDIYEKFNKFCEKNKSFKKTDLLTHAIFRYLEDFDK